MCAVGIGRGWLGLRVGRGLQDLLVRLENVQWVEQREESELLTLEIFLSFSALSISSLFSNIVLILI